MSRQQVSFGKIDVGLTTGSQPAAAAQADEPFYIAILGDFSGRANRRELQIGAALAGRRAVMVDRDNFDEVLAKFGTRLSLPVAGSAEARIQLQFGELDDFHPDRLYDKLEIFQKLRETRRELGDSKTFAAAAEKVQGWLQSPKKEPQRSPAALAPDELPTVRLNSQALMEEMLASSQARAEETGRMPFDIDALVRAIVEPYVLPGRDPRQPEMIASVDKATSAEMAALLHQPDFQTIESAWRGLYFLIRRLETDAKLKVFVFDVSKAELTADVAAAEDLTTTGLYKLLVERTVGTAGGKRWALIVGNYAFDATAADAQLLGRIGRIAAQATAPFLAAGTAGLVGCESFGTAADPDDWNVARDADAEQAWSQLRSLGDAAAIGIVTPRFLLRVPYGKKSDRTEHFDFEEMPDKPEHEHYLWGNPALACAAILGDAFSRNGWRLDADVEQTIEGLPVHTYDEDGEPEVKACAEAYLVDRAVSRIMDAGLMPLVTLKYQNAARLYSVHSIASPQRPLAGRWR